MSKAVFRAQTITGKQYVAATFALCLAGIIEVMGTDFVDCRWLSRSPGSWYIYTSEREMLKDIADGRRGAWRAWIGREEKR